jgi:NADPH:quinone reductase-like Zn-dependent oxidoreductase
MYALYFLGKQCQLKKGQSILINGASGSLGTYAVQLAKHYFGAKVTAVCSTKNITLVRKLGADKVIDYTKETLIGSPNRYDCILDTVGTMEYRRYGFLIHDEGVYVSAVISSADMFCMLFTALRGKKKMLGGSAKGDLDDFKLLKKLVEAGKITTIIDRTYFFSDLPKAHTYVEQGHKRGNVVVLVKEFKKPSKKF